MMGLPATGAMGLGMSAVSGKSLVPLPAARTIAFICSIHLSVDSYRPARDSASYPVPSGTRGRRERLSWVRLRDSWSQQGEGLEFVVWGNDDGGARLTPSRTEAHAGERAQGGMWTPLPETPW